MEKKLSDYLHFYLFSNISAFVLPDEVIENGQLKKYVTRIPDLVHSPVLTLRNYHRYLEDGYKPILRPLSSMEEELLVELVLMRSDCYKNVSAEKVNQHVFSFEFEYSSSRRRRSSTMRFDELSADQFNYLLLEGFDIFGLIEAGLAIDKTKLDLCLS
jgi:hypothetical protein